MWFWLIIAVLGLAVGGLIVSRSSHSRLRGSVIFGIASASALLIELLIRFGAISVDQDTRLMSLAVLMLIVAIITWTPLDRRGV